MIKLKTRSLFLVFSKLDLNMKSVIIFVLFLNISLSLFAQDTLDNNCICCTKEHTQFDFWVGEWSVYDTLNNFVGTNNVIKDYDNCLIQENWKSAGKNRGTSYNYFDLADSTWNQLWIDNQGTILNLKGQLINGAMILKSKLQKGKKVALYYNRITWSKLENGNVVQTWDILDENDQLLANLFKGIYNSNMN
jgi:hypothetical protein